MGQLGSLVGVSREGNSAGLVDNGDLFSVFPAREITRAWWIKGDLLSEFLAKEILPV